MFRIFVASFCIGVLSLPIHVFSASIYMEPADIQLAQGDGAIVSIRLDIDPQLDECINVVDAVIDIPDTLRVVDTSIGRSILRFWVEEPVFNANTNQVTFAGGIPNGYCGRIPGDPQVTNVLVELAVRAADMSGDNQGTSSPMFGEITFSDRTTAYLNDGFGTIAPLQTFGATVELLDTPGDVITDPWIDTVQNDTIPPEPFSISLERDDSIFNGEYFIVFNTTDKQSGLAGYEVMEEPLAEQRLFRFGAADAPWIAARSPYKLQDQTLNSTIYVRAYDKAGNERIATFVPDPSLRQSQLTWGTALAFGVMALSILLLAFFVWRTVRQRRGTEVVDTAEGGEFQTSDTEAAEHPPLAGHEVDSDNDSENNRQYD